MKLVFEDVKTGVEYNPSEIWDDFEIPFNELAKLYSPAPGDVWTGWLDKNYCFPPKKYKAIYK